LKSLKTAGWEPVVFAEPDSPIPEDFHGPVVQRWRPFGDWTNWATGLYDLLMSEPDADYYFMAEDDSVTCEGCKDYLEWAIPQITPFATVSPHCPEKYYTTDFVGFHNECESWRTWCTLAIIMSKAGVRSFFSDPDVQRHRFEHIFPLPFDEMPWGVTVDPKNSVKDAVLGLWASKNQLPMYYHSPSLFQHTGVTSTLGPDRIIDDGLASDFVGEDFKPNWDSIRIRQWGPNHIAQL
jgi:hypothetical protein